MITNNLYGWFDSADQAKPTYDPPHDAECPYCGECMSLEDIRTHSIMMERGPRRAYFYRTHRTCDQAATEAQSIEVSNAVWNRINAEQCS